MERARTRLVLNRVTTTSHMHRAVKIRNDAASINDVTATRNLIQIEIDASESLDLKVFIFFFPFFRFHAL